MRLTPISTPDRDGFALVTTLLILLVLSVIAVGAAWLASSEKRASFAESVHLSAVYSADAGGEAGINFLDTANVYSRDRSEEVTGEALKRNGKRQQIVLATKVHGVMDDDDPNMRGNSRRHIIQQ